MTRTLLLCLLMVAWPWTVKAQDTLKAPHLLVTLDSASLARLAQVVDSIVAERMAKVGRWERREVWLGLLHWDDPNWIVRDTSLTHPCSAWVWIRQEGK